MVAPRHSVPVSPEPSALARTTGHLPVAVETTAIAVAAQAKAAIEARYLMALQKPRDWTLVRKNILAACERPRFAGEARYALPRAGKEIEGLSIRFAEEVVRWIGNAMVEAVVTFEDDERRILRVIATDLEANVTWPFDVVIEKFVERRKAEDRDVLSSRMNSQNQRVYKVRATDDEILIKQNAIASKAMRNGVLRLIPADIQEEALEQIKATQSGMSKEKGNIDRLIRAFARTEIAREMIQDVIGHPVEQMTPDEFAILSATGQAIKDGETTWAAFAESYLRQTKRDKPTAPPVAPVQGGGYDEDDRLDDARLAGEDR